MMGGKKNLRILRVAIFVTIFACLSLSPIIALAAPSISLEADRSTIDLGGNKNFQVKVNVDPGGENVTGFRMDVNFSTEVLEYQGSQNASDYFCFEESLAKINCAKKGGSITSNGLAVTLNFKGRNVGVDTITLSNVRMIQVDPIDTSKSKDITISAIGSAQISVIDGSVQPVNQTSGQASGQSSGGSSGQSSTSQNSHTSSIVAPTSISTPIKAPTEATPPSQTIGSIPQVIGPTGANSEEIIKRQAEGDAASKGIVEGLMDKSPIKFSYLTNILMLLLVGVLGVKLFFTEKKRQLQVERLFEEQIGMLSSLESKVDIFDQKGDGAKEKLLDNFEDAKNSILTQVSTLGKKIKNDKDK